MSKKGNDLVRKALFMASLSALRANPAIRALYARKRRQGKDKMVALGHCMRKLLHLVYAILSQNQPFDPQHYPWDREASPPPSNEAARPQNDIAPHAAAVDEEQSIQGSPTSPVASEPAPRPTDAASASRLQPQDDPVSFPPRPGQTERADTQKCPPKT